jgi:hypothetical protein
LSPEEQKAIIENVLLTTQGNLKMTSLKGKPKDKRFIVSAIWWRKWTDFVNFDAPSVPQSNQKDLLTGDKFHNELLSLKLKLTSST